MSFRVGMSAPYYYERIVTSDDAAIDLSAVVDPVVFKVLKPTGTVVEWDASIEDQSTTKLRLRHVFEDDDLDVQGTYVIYPSMPLDEDAGTLVDEPKQVPILGAFDISKG